MNDNQIIVYENGEVEITVSLDNQNETIWANTKEIAQIFLIDRSVVSRHIKNIFKDGELDEKVVCADFAHTTQHGALNNKTQTKMVKYYNLDIILAVGYRTNSRKAIEFRRWATQILKQFAIITKPLSKQLKLDINKYNSQYDNLEIKTSNTFHDRFLIMDDEELYHIGASLKDLGKRVFAFSKMDEGLLETIRSLK